jgi:hypothetical protein
MVCGTPGSLWIDQFEVKVADDLGDNFGHFHQTNVLSDTCSGSQSELGVRGTLDEGLYSKEISVKALVVFIVDEPSFGDEFVDIGTKDVCVSMRDPAVDADDCLSLAIAENRCVTPALNFRPARTAPPLGTTRAKVRPVAGWILIASFITAWR